MIYLPDLDRDLSDLSVQRVHITFFLAVLQADPAAGSTALGRRHPARLLPPSVRLQV